MALIYLPGNVMASPTEYSEDDDAYDAYDDDDDDDDDDDIDKEESCVGCGQKPTAVKSWQVPPLSSPLLPPLVCISSISHLDFL